MRAAGDHATTPPEDPAALRALLLAALEKCDALAAERDGVALERDALAVQNERLRHLLAKLTRMQFGRKSERLPEEQLHFAFEEIAASIAANEADAEKRSAELRRKRAEARRTGRGRLPAHLPRVELVLEPEDTACPCCRGEMAVIGHDTSERLDVIPAQFRVLVTRRPKLACRACEGVVVQAPAPERLIEGGMPTEATVAQVLVSRYADHRVPRTHRQRWRCGAV
jgi:transposase